MIKGFDFVKKQLLELAGVLNEFKSEVVQLRVVQLLFERMETVSEEDKPEKKKKEIKRKAKPKAKPKEKETRSKMVSKGGRPGPGAIVSQLIEEGFFKTPKVIQDVVTHTQSESGHDYKTGGLNTGLLRAVRNKALQRRKNAQGQFEYYE